MNIKSVQTMTAGNGDVYGFVSLADSANVVVFRRHEDGKWRGTVEFCRDDSSGVFPGEAIPPVAERLDRAAP